MTGSLVSQLPGLQLGQLGDQPLLTWRPLLREASPGHSRRGGWHPPEREAVCESSRGLGWELAPCCCVRQSSIKGARTRGWEKLQVSWQSEWVQGGQALGYRHQAPSLPPPCLLLVPQDPSQPRSLTLSPKFPCAVAADYAKLLSVPLLYPGFLS